MLSVSKITDKEQRAARAFRIRDRITWSQQRIRELVVGARDPEAMIHLNAARFAALELRLRTLSDEFKPTFDLEKHVRVRHVRAVLHLVANARSYYAGATSRR